MNITEDYCSFEVSKLLKERGFDEYCLKNYWSTDKELHNWNWELSYRRNSDGNRNTRDCAAPTLQMALKWLRKIHKININVLYDLQRFVKIDGTKEDIDVYEVDIITKNGTIYIGNYNHYESACEAAIKYCLTNLI